MSDTDIFLVQSFLKTKQFEEGQAADFFDDWFIEYLLGLQDATELDELVSYGLAFFLNFKIQLWRKRVNSITKLAQTAPNKQPLLDQAIKIEKAAKMALSMLQRIAEISNE